MNTRELETLIEGQKEHPGLDFKASSPFDVKKLAKDILAMSNLADGGYIVVGLEEDDNTFIRKGVTEADCKTYILDEMRDKLSGYADPMVEFDVHFPKGLDGLTYVVIRIYSFKETPTICKKDSSDLKAGTIYYRNTNRRVESAAVSNVNDLRDIIELAAVRLIKRRHSFGYVLPVDNSQYYRSEIENANKLSLAKLIKSKGYCEISITPLGKSNLRSLQNCLDVVEKSQVRLGWTLPFIPLNPVEGSIDTAEDCYQGTSDLGARKEVWRIHISEHFYMLNAFVEDWMEGDILRGQLANKFPSGRFFFFYTSLLFYVTQLFEFIGRLAGQGLYKEGVKVVIGFHNMKDRELYLDSDRSTPFMRKRTTTANIILINEEYYQAQIIEETTKLSQQVILKVSEYYQFTPSADSIQIEQLKYLNGR